MKDKSLEIEVIWKDDDMFELQITVNNGRYSGKTEVYDTKQSLLPFATNLKEFSNNPDNLFHRCGEKDSYAFFEMKFYKIGITGVIGLQVTIEENVETEYRKEEKSKLVLELIIEPNSIDIFQKELVYLAKNEKGIAKLIGI